jgi:nitrite reductase (NADH) small subunit
MLLKVGRARDADFLPRCSNLGLVIDMPMTKVASATDLAPGQVMEVQSGDRSFALCNLNGQLYCLDGTCPHAGGPLGQGALEGDLLVCPWHGYEFHCATGGNDFDDLAVETFKVAVQDGSIFIDVPE